MNIQEYVKSVDLNQGVNALNPYYDKMEKVTLQATRHCTRSDMSDFFNIIRPNEEKVFTDWRKANLRHITVSSILAFKRMLKRTLKTSFRIPEIDNKLFDDFNDFVFEDILTYILIDPNAVGIEWPYNPVKPQVPLAVPGSFPQNERIASETKIFNFDKVVLNEKDLVILQDGQVNVGTEKSQQWVNAYIACDTDNYYKLLPSKDSHGKITYSIHLWYKHDLKRVPVFRIPGVKTKDAQVDDLNGYNETYVWGAYELLDEAVIAISSDQVNRIRNILPKLVVNADLLCPTCNGAGHLGPIADKKICNTCKGIGSIKEIGDFSTVNVRAKTEFDRSNPNPVFYVQQPSDVKYSKEIWEDLLVKADRQLCTDLLEGTGNESAVAKELRLEPRQDLLVDIGESLARTVEDYINNKQQLVNAKAKHMPIVPPSYYETKSPDVLKLYVEQSLPGERQRDYMMYVKSKYQGNDFMIDVHMKAVLYAPLLLYKNEEAMAVIAAGSYDTDDIKRRDYAIMALQEVLRSGQHEDNKSIFLAADALLIEWGVLQEKTDIGSFDFDEITSVDQLPDDLDELEEVLTKLLHNEISREDALKLVMIIEGIDEAEAEALLEDTGL